MRSNLTATEKKLVDALAKKEKVKPEDYLIILLQNQYHSVYKRPFNG